MARALSGFVREGPCYQQSVLEQDRACVTGQWDDEAHSGTGGSSGAGHPQKRMNMRVCVYASVLLCAYPVCMFLYQLMPGPMASMFPAVCLCQAHVSAVCLCCGHVSFQLLTCALCRFSASIPLLTQPHLWDQSCGPLQHSSCLFQIIQDLSGWKLGGSWIAIG